ncbi:MAG: Holliday junction branch migration DNA helicase RuvB [Planctomycetota bacterium]
MTEENNSETSPQLLAKDEADTSLRPSRLSEFKGQPKLVEKLIIFIQAAKSRGEVLEHILFSGPPGLGKTTLAYMIANEVGSRLKVTSGPVLEKPYDLAGILVDLKAGDILFIDEIHRLNHVITEYLYSAMEEFVLDLIYDQGTMSKSVRLDLQPFTLVGATTREGLLLAPFRDRFGFSEKLELYTTDSLVEILRRSARVLKIGIDEKSLLLIAQRSRGTPRIANKLLRRVRDVAQYQGSNTITEVIAQKGLEMMDVDQNGLGSMDRKILQNLFELGGGPVGLKSISIQVQEEEETIEEVYEPYLVQQGYLIRTAKGRKVTAKAWADYGSDPNAKKQKKLFLPP